MNRVLITGATGFIGRHCLGPVAALDYEIHAVGHFRQPVAGSNIEWHTADLLDGHEISRLIDDVCPTHLMHLAWYAEPRDYRMSGENLYWLQASTAMLRSFIAAGGRRVVFVGTCFEYDPRFGYCVEGLTPEAPTTFYATCKNSLRQVLTGYGACVGLSVAWARIFHLFGPHEPAARLVPSVILSILRGGRAACTHGRQVRDFLYVEDVASALAAILHSGVQGVVNVGSGEPVTIRSLVARIATLTQAEDRVDFGAIQQGPSNPPAIMADVNRLHEDVGWRGRWTLDEGLMLTIDWWREFLANGNNLEA